MLVTRMPRDSRIAAREAAAMPFPREETTPPVTKTYFVIDPRRVGMEEFTGNRAGAQIFCALGVAAGNSADAVPPQRLPLDSLLLGLDRGRRPFPEPRRGNW